MTGVFVRIAGWLTNAIKLSEAHRQAVLDSRPRLDRIWDPIRYIVLPMLRPLLILEVYTGYIFEYGGQYYGFQRSHRKGLAELYGGDISIEGSQLFRSELCKRTHVANEVSLLAHETLDSLTWSVRRSINNWYELLLVGIPKDAHP